jgi:hypothetical protein
MRTSLSLLVAFAMPCALSAQVYQQFTSMQYQGVARDAGGAPIGNQAIGLQITISFGLSYAYVETQTATTDAFGVFRVDIGTGTPTGGTFPSFDAIDWNAAYYYGIQVAFDPTGGTNYANLTGGQLRMVPFAGMAREAIQLADGAWTVDAVNIDVSSGASYKVGIGTPDPQAKLHVVGTTRLVDGTQGAGKVLTSDASGNAAWSTVVSAGDYTTTWTSTGGFTTAPTAPSCSYNRVGNVVNVVCRFGGAGPTYSAGTNTATITVPPGLPIANVPNGELVSGTFISDHYRNGSQTSVGIVANNSSTTVFLKMNGSSAGVAGSYCSFTYRTSAP